MKTCYELALAALAEQLKEHANHAQKKDGGQEVAVRCEALDGEPKERSGQSGADEVGHGSGSLGQPRGLAENLPVHVRAKRLAADAGFPLDVGASLGRDLPRGLGVL